MSIYDLLRYTLWGAVAVTAEANRREYHMSTTWLPHLLTNTLTLFLPDLYRDVTDSRWFADQVSTIQVLDDLQPTLDTMLRDNPAYVAYVMPLALGYILSHPRFNIYKGSLAEIRVAGLGLDALPHAATAFALTALVSDTLDAAAEEARFDGPLATIIEESERHPVLASFTILGLVTLWWELGEYLIHRHELSLRGDDETKITTQCSLRDTLNDIFANAIGWAVAILFRRTR